MQTRCRKKPLLYTLMAAAALSVCICFVALTILQGVEGEFRGAEPRLRPIVKYGVANNQRDILYVGNDGAPGQRNKRELSQGSGKYWDTCHIDSCHQPFAPLTNYTHYIVTSLEVCIK